MPIMFSERLSRIYDKVISALVLRSSARQIEQIGKINPHKFYVEDIRVMMNTSTSHARFVCEKGVEEGSFDRHVEVLHPHTGRTIRTADSKEALPREVELGPGLDDEDEEPKIIPTSNLKLLTYYSLRQK